MIPLSIPRKLRASQSLFYILDTKNAHTLTPVKIRTRAGRRISSPRVVDSLNRTSTHRTLGISNDTYLKDSDTPAIPSQPDTKVPGVALPNSSGSKSMAVDAHQTIQHSQDGNAANPDVVKKLLDKYPGFSDIYPPAKKGEPVDQPWGHTAQSSASHSAPPARSPGPSYSSGSQPRPPQSTPSHQQSSEAEQASKQYNPRKNLYHMKNPGTRRAPGNRNPTTQPISYTSASAAASSSSKQRYKYANLQQEMQIESEFGENAGKQVAEKFPDNPSESFVERFADRVADRVVRKLSEVVVYSGERDVQLVSDNVVEDANDPGALSASLGVSVVGPAPPLTSAPESKNMLASKPISQKPVTPNSSLEIREISEPHTSTPKHPPGRPIVKTTVAPLHQDPQETKDIEYCWENRVARPDHPLHRIREGVRRRTEIWIQKEFGSSYTVKFFGSLRYAVSYVTSDLDMVILDKQRPRGFEGADFHSAPIYNVNKLASVLRRAGFVDVSTRPWASVPIVQFRDPKSNLECDVNVNDRLGVVNSDLLRTYCKMFPVLRPLLYEVKEWAKPLLLNSPTGAKGISASFSSYALAIMTVGFLQDKYGLPSLQKNLPGPPLLSSGVTPSDPVASMEEYHEHLKFTKKPHQGWDTRYHEKGVPWEIPFTKNVKVVKQEWARYWTKFPHETHAIDIRADGGLVERPLDSMDTICVMDPFITTKNVARGVSKAVFDYFIERCEDAAMDANNKFSRGPVQRSQMTLNRL